MLRKKRIIFICAVILLVFGLLAGFIRGKYVPPILAYHMIEPQFQYALAISDKTFEKQMKFFKERHYNLVTLEQLAILIREHKKIPPRTVSITFDDGYQDNYTYAFPVLKKYGIPATIFLIYDEVGRSANDRLSWEMIKEMQSSGLITFGSHTLGPEPLINFKSKEEIKRQIFESKRLLEEKLGRTVNFFSYPEGFFTPEIRQMVIDANYLAAVGTKTRKGYPNDDVFVLKRLRISENSRNMFIFWAETSGYYTFFKENKRKHRKS